jgi:hypothetical protein
VADSTMAEALLRGPAGALGMLIMDGAEGAAGMDIIEDAPLAEAEAAPGTVPRRTAP